MDIIMEAHRAQSDHLRFGVVSIYEIDVDNNLHQYFLGTNGNYLMKITIYAGQGIRWDISNDFYRKMQESHDDRWDDRFEFIHPLYGRARLVKNYMFKQLNVKSLVEDGVVINKKST